MRVLEPHAPVALIGYLCGTCGSGPPSPRETAEPGPELDAILEQARPLGHPALGMILPNGGLDLSGDAIARGLGAFRGSRVRRIVLLASDPQGEAGARMSNGRHETPFGSMPGDAAAAALLARYPRFAPDEQCGAQRAFASPLALLRRSWPEAPVLCVLVGPSEPAVLTEIGLRLRHVLHEDTLFVACATVVHGRAGNAGAIVSGILARDSAPWRQAREAGESACGLEAVEVFLAAIGPGEPGVTLAGEDRGGTTFAVAFPGRHPTVPALERPDRLQLGEIVERTVRAAVKGEPIPALERLSPRLGQRGGAFVTLTEGGTLKGCMGRLDGESLAAAAQQAARMAACGDPRFPSIDEEALGRVEIEISVLGDFVAIDDVEAEFEPGRHGLLLTQGFHRGLLLPQVATHHGLDRRAFLETLARKAGLAPHGWRGAKLERFGVEAFSPSPI